MEYAELIRVLVAIESVYLRDGVRLVLHREGDVEVVAQESPGDPALDAIEDHRPDIVIASVDIWRPDTLTFCRNVREVIPPPAVVAMAARASDDELLASLAAGASAYVSQANQSDLIAAVRAVAAGATHFDREASDRVLQSLVARTSLMEAADSLTDRERTVLRMVGKGLDNRQIASRLNIAPTTARNHVGRILRKIGMANRMQLISFAAQREVVLALTRQSQESD